MTTGTEGDSMLDDHTHYTFDVITDYGTPVRVLYVPEGLEPYRDPVTRERLALVEFYDRRYTDPTTNRRYAGNRRVDWSVVGGQFFGAYDVESILNHPSGIVLDTGHGESGWVIDKNTVLMIVSWVRMVHARNGFTTAAK